MNIHIYYEPYLLNLLNIIFYRCIQSLCKIGQEDPILDVGCGNALLLIQLVIIFYSLLCYIYIYYNIHFFLFKKKNQIQIRLN